MTLRYMQIFVCVYKNMSMTRAAQEMHLAQPSVSLAIRELEEYYDTRLFDRLNRRIFPTESGKRLYEYAVGIISSFEQIEKIIGNSDSFGSVKIGTSITIGNYILPVVQQQFCQTLPDVKLSCVIRNSAAIENAVLKNEIDIGLIENEAVSENIVQIPFMNDRLCLIAPTNHPLSEKQNVLSKELCKYDFLVREKGSAGRDIIDSFFSLNNIHINIVLESISTQAIVHSVSSGMGIAILPFRLVENDINENRVKLITVKDMNLARKFNIIYHRGKFLTNSMNRLINICKSLEEEK